VAPTLVAPWWLPGGSNYDEASDYKETETTKGLSREEFNSRSRRLMEEYLTCSSG